MLVESRQRPSHSGFAGSEWPLDEKQLDLIIALYAQEYARRFLELHGRVLQEHSKGLVPLIESWVDQTASVNPAWDYTFGRVRQAVLEPTSMPSVVQTGLLMGLRLLASGIEGEFRSHCGQPVRPIWDHFLLPKSARLDVSAKNGMVRLEAIADGHRAQVSFRVVEGRWTSESAEALTSYRSDAINFAILPSSAAMTVGCGSVAPVRHRDVVALKHKCSEAIELIARHAPAFLPWIARVLRYVVPLQARPGILRSASGPENPGVVEISFKCQTVGVAEMLIHECAHQYFFLLSRLEAVHDGTDRTLYFSPVKNFGRPIDKILLAYHAFANVLIFYRSCLSSGLDDNGYCERNERDLVPQLEELESALRKTNALTAAGNSLWMPLASRIR